MSKLYLIKSDCQDTFDKGSFLLSANNFLSEIKFDKCVEFTEEFKKNCIEIPLEHLNEIRCMSKEQRINLNDDDLLQKVINTDIIDKRPSTTYHEGVIIDPPSIHKWEKEIYESMLLDNHVELTLRDSCVTYQGKVAWLGKANGIDVAAVNITNSIDNSNISNFLYKGNFGSELSEDISALIVPLSLTRKMSPAAINTPDRIKEILKSLKNGIVSDDVCGYVKFISDNLGYFNVLPGNIIKEFLNFPKVLLHLLRDGFTKEKFKTAKTISDLVDNDRKLLSCCAELLDILFNISFEHLSVAQEIFQNVQLMDTMEQVVRELRFVKSQLEEINRIFLDVIAIIWTVNKSVKIKDSMVNDWISIMTDIYRDVADPSIKLIAALNLSLLVSKSYNNLPDLVKYLKETLKYYPDNIDSRRIFRNDILIALGKIFDLDDGSLNKKVCSDSVQPPMIPEESISAGEESYAVLEHCAQGEGLFQTKELESLIKLLVRNYTTDSQEDIDKLMMFLPKLIDKEIFSIFITRQKNIDYERYLAIIPEISHSDEMFKDFLNICNIPKTAYIDVVKIASSLIDVNKTSNIEQLLRKIFPLDNELDVLLLNLAFTALIKSESAILTLALSKCTSVNSIFNGGYTFITYIIEKHSNEDDIIRAIDCNYMFEVNKLDDRGTLPVVLASKRKFKNLYDYIVAKGVGLMDCYGYL